MCHSQGRGPAWALAGFRVANCSNVGNTGTPHWFIPSSIHLHLCTRVAEPTPWQFFPLGSA